MAHVGKNYPYAFERDFSFRYVGQDYRALAKQYKIFPWNWSNTTVTMSGNHVISDVAVADYDAGTMSYVFTPITCSVPGLKMRWVYTLEPTIFMFKQVTEVFAPDRVWYRGEHRFRTFSPDYWRPFASLEPIPPTPPGVLGAFYELTAVPWPP